MCRAHQEKSAGGKKNLINQCTKKRKNILLILSDQQRLDTVSAYGMNQVCRTPNIDWLAENGMKFTNAFTASAICSPSRASVMTGLFPHNHGVIDNHTELKPDVPLLSRELGQAGYYCAYAGKWHVSMDRTPEDCGMDGKAFMGYGFPGSRVFRNLAFYAPPVGGNPYLDYLKENDLEIPDVSECFMGNNPELQIQEMYARHDGPLESTIEYFVAKEAMDKIEKASRQEKPFFLWANFWGPHSPSIVPEPYFSMYDPEEIAEYPSYKDDLSDKPYGHTLVEKMWGLGDYGWKGMAEIAARYYGHCTMIDDMVGMILDKLREKGMLEDTIVVYSADHGDCLGAHRLMEKGPFLYDEIYRVPLVVYGLGKEDNDSLVYLHELMPSFLEIGGAKCSRKLDGDSLVPLMKGVQQDNGRTEIYQEFHNHFYVGRMRAVRSRDYQFVFNENDIGEFYDLKNDPYQLVNRRKDPVLKSIRDEMKQKLLRHMEESGDPAQVWYRRIHRYYE